MPTTFQLPRPEAQRIAQLRVCVMPLQALADDHFVNGRIEHAAFDNFYFGVNFERDRQNSANYYIVAAATDAVHQGLHRQLRRRIDGAVRLAPNLRQEFHRVELIELNRRVSLGCGSLAQNNNVVGIASIRNRRVQSRHKGHHDHEHADDQRDSAAGHGSRNPPHQQRAHVVFQRYRHLRQPSSARPRYCAARRSSLAPAR